MAVKCPILSVKLMHIKQLHRNLKTFVILHSQYKQKYSVRKDMKTISIKLIRVQIARKITDFLIRYIFLFHHNSLVSI